MYAFGKRNIKPGYEFDQFFSKPAGTEVTVISRDATVDDTLALIFKTVKNTAWQTEEIANVLKASTWKQSYKNLFDFVYTHIQYRPDKKLVEQVRSPRRTWADRKSGVDCDCYSTFIASVLFNWGITPVFRVIRQHGKPDFHHIYVIIPDNSSVNGLSGNYTTLDCVLDTFDQEPHSIAEIKDYSMKLTSLDGPLGCNCNSLNGDNKLQIRFAVLKDGSVIAIDQNGEQYEVDLPALNEYSLQLNGGLGKTIVGKFLKKVGNIATTAANLVVESVTAPFDVARDVIKGENFWEAVKDQGKEFISANKEFVASVNVIDPSAALVRLGIRKALEINLFNIARRYRWAYISDEEAKARGWDIEKFAKLKSAKAWLEDTYRWAGGNPDNVKKYILQGKGNRDGKMDIPPAPPLEYTDTAATIEIGKVYPLGAVEVRLGPEMQGTDYKVYFSARGANSWIDMNKAFKKAIIHGGVIYGMTSDGSIYYRDSFMGGWANYTMKDLERAVGATKASALNGGLGEAIAAVAAIVAALATLIAAIAKLKGADGPDDCDLDAPEPVGNAEIDAKQTEIYNSLKAACQTKVSTSQILDTIKDKAADIIPGIVKQETPAYSEDNKQSNVSLEPNTATAGINWFWVILGAGGLTIGYNLLKGGKKPELTEAEKEMQRRKAAKALSKPVNGLSGHRKSKTIKVKKAASMKVAKPVVKRELVQVVHI